MAKVKCIDCKYATVDKHASIGGWTAYECSNPDGEYHKALLNVGINGERQKQISWQGCELGRRRDRDETLSKAGTQDRT